MTILDLVIIILLFLALMFFLTMFFLCRGWAKPMHHERSAVIGLMVASLYTFWFLLVEFLLAALIWIVWRLRPFLESFSF